MLILRDLIYDLKYGELQRFNLQGTLTVGLQEEHYPMIITLLNQAMLDLYTRLPLMLQELYLQPKEEVTMYKLSKAHAVTNTASTKTKWIIDSPDNPFDGMLLKIDSVYDEQGCKLPLNDMEACNSLFTPSIDTLQVPNPDPNKAIGVIYRSAPRPLLVITDLTQELDVPLAYKQALLKFVVGKCHAARAHADTEGKMAYYMQEYLTEVTRLEGEGYLLSDDTSNHKLYKRGYV